MGGKVAPITLGDVCAGRTGAAGLPEAGGRPLQTNRRAGLLAGGWLPVHPARRASPISFAPVSNEARRTAAPLRQV
jgi:hypothetical protein